MVAFDQITQYVDSVGINPIPLDAHALDNPHTLDAVRRGYQHAAALGYTATLDADALDTVRAAVAEVYAADVVDNEVVSSDAAEIAERLLWVRTRPEWGVGADCVESVTYYNPSDANLYRCVQSHPAQSDWRPDLQGVSALWVRYYTDEWPEWVQPTGAHDAYQIGDKVTFEGQHYVSLINANVWSPAAYPAGWELQA